MSEFERDYAFCDDKRPTAYFTGQDRATFQGIVREDGRVAHPQLHRRDDHGELLRHGREARRRRVREWRAGRLSRTSMAWSRWCTAPAAAWRPRARASTSCSASCGAICAIPNFAGVLLIGLGCEAAQIRFLLEAYGIKATETFQYMTIQGTGGTRATIEEGVKRVKAMLPKANQVKRETVSAEHLSLCLQCGGSDGYSGITANPALGAAADLLVRHGGTAILSETPEIYGAEHLLTRRAVEPQDRREADRPHQVVGGLHQPQRRRDEQQPVARQQGRRPHHHPREVAGRRGQGRHDQPGRCLQIRRADHRQGLRVHGFAGLRPGLRDRPGGERRQHHLLHHRPRLGLRLQAGAEHQARHQHRHVPEACRRTWTSIAARC